MRGTKRIMEAVAVLAVLTMIVIMAAACGGKEPEEKTPTATPASEATPTPEATGEAEYEAKYLGVKDYGEPETKKENIAQFLYRFSIDGSEKTFSVDNSALDAPSLRSEIMPHM